LKSIFSRLESARIRRWSSAVIVCHCKAVTDRAIRSAIRDGARCRRSVARACAAGRSCGGCAPAIDEIVQSELEVLGATPLSSLPDLATAS
jgi:bacterioferritin-associated ferredoxin